MVPRTSKFNNFYTSHLRTGCLSEGTELDAKISSLGCSYDNQSTENMPIEEAYKRNLKIVEKGHFLPNHHTFRLGKGSLSKGTQVDVGISSPSYNHVIKFKQSMPIEGQHELI